MSFHFPDTPIVQEARKIVQAALSPPIWQHSLRTYLLGNQYGTKTDQQYSQEYLMLAALFHDIGLFPPYKKAQKSFQICSSLSLKAFLLTHKQIPPARINAMMEAIDFHMQLRPRWDKGTLAGLLQIGAHMDVLGSKKRVIGKQVYQSVQQQFPRTGFFLNFNTCLCKTFTDFKSIRGLMQPTVCQDANHYLDC